MVAQSSCLSTGEAEAVWCKNWVQNMERAEGGSKGRREGVGTQAPKPSLVLPVLSHDKFSMSVHEKSMKSMKKVKLNVIPTPTLHTLDTTMPINFLDDTAHAYTQAHPHA